MIKQELKKLSRADLLEMLIKQTEENDELREKLRQTQAQLSERTIACEEAGNIAEAALRLNDVFASAQAACDQYTENIKARNAEIEAACDKKEQETEAKCQQMINEAKKQSEAYWNQVHAKVEELMSQSALLRKILTDSKITSDEE